MTEILKKHYKGEESKYVSEESNYVSKKPKYSDESNCEEFEEYKFNILEVEKAVKKMLEEEEEEDVVMEEDCTPIEFVFPDEFKKAISTEETKYVPYFQQFQQLPQQFQFPQLPQQFQFPQLHQQFQFPQLPQQFQFQQFQFPQQLHQQPPNQFKCEAQPERKVRRSDLSSLFTKEENSFKLVFDTANVFGLQYEKIMKGTYTPVKEIQDILCFLHQCNGIRINSLKFCHKNTKTSVSDVYYKCLRRLITGLESKFKFKEMNVPVSLDVYEYQGLTEQLFNEKGKKIENESDDTGLIANENNSKVLIVTFDQLRNLRENIEKLRSYDAKLHCVSHDVATEFEVRGEEKMQIEGKVISFRDLNIPRELFVLDPRNLQFRVLYPYRSTMKEVCKHTITSVKCTCKQNYNNKKRRYNK